jgi:hypothetical protein
MGIADAVFPSAIAAVSLGIVGPNPVTQRVGQNAAFTHAGTAATALAGAAGGLFTPSAVFWLVATLGAARTWATLQIDAGAIDHALARGTDNIAFLFLAPVALAALMLFWIAVPETAKRNKSLDCQIR